MRGFDDLLAGYQRFRRNSYPTHSDTYKALAAEGQSPRIMVISCCDSRVDPATIFDAGPGELFVVRNVANLVPPYTTDGGHHGTSAAIEFAVGSLEIAHIVVMGHAACGGVRALMDRGEKTEDDGSHIGRWMSIARPAHHRTLEGRFKPGTDAFAESLEKAVVSHSLENLKTFPLVRNAMNSRGLRLHGAWFNVESGALYLMEPAGDEFIQVESPER